MPVKDNFILSGRGAALLTSPWEHAFNIVPDDSVPLSTVPRAIYVGTGGDLRVQFLGGEIVTLVGLPGGSMAPIRVEKVFATGTTAGDLVGGW